MQYVLAVDIGASGGRHMLAGMQDGRVVLEEVYRFDNGMRQKGGRLVWDVQALFADVVEGMRRCAQLGKTPLSVGIDTWGVDYVLLDADDRPVGDAVAYRDSRTQGMEARLEAALPFDAHYRVTGIARQSYNTVYQLMSEPRSVLDRARACLMMPDYLHFLLAGVKANEYTEASTTALLDAHTRAWSPQVLEAAGIPQGLFDLPLKFPGDVLGALRPEVARAAGFDCRVVLPGTHDTASAFFAVPAQDAQAATLSSGTWSLLGATLDAPLTGAACREAGFTNEGGCGGITCVRNIMGLWILQSIRRELDQAYSHAQLAELAREGTRYEAVFDVNDARLLAPERMTDAVLSVLADAGHAPPRTLAELLCCVHRSLAGCYAQGVKQLERLTGRRITSLHVAGGGSRNRTLNQWTADATGVPVFAGPAECTALGNALCQLIAAGEIGTREEALQRVRESFPMERYEPEGHR